MLHLSINDLGEQTEQKRDICHEPIEVSGSWPAETRFHPRLELGVLCVRYSRYLL